MILYETLEIERLQLLLDRQSFRNIYFSKFRKTRASCFIILQFKTPLLAVSVYLIHLLLAKHCLLLMTVNVSL